MSSFPVVSRCSAYTKMCERYTQILNSVIEHGSIVTIDFPDPEVAGAIHNPINNTICTTCQYNKWYIYACAYLYNVYFPCKNYREIEASALWYLSELPK